MKDRSALEEFHATATESVVSGTKIIRFDFSDGKNRVGTVGIFDWWDGRYIEGLEVTDEYKGSGLSHALVDFAVSKLGADSVSVEKSNSIAMRIYEEKGFVPVDHDDKYIYMRITNSVECERVE